MKLRINTDVKDINDFINRIVSRYHFTNDDVESLKDVYQQLQFVISPYAEYRINQCSTGVEIIDKSTCAAVAMSLGAGVDKLQERFMREERISEAYMLDCICSEILLLMYKEFNNSYSRFHRRFVERYVFIGNEIPTENTGSVIAYIRGVKNESDAPKDILKMNEKEYREALTNNLEHRDVIEANKYGVITPAKSVVFYAILSENPATKCQGICSGCGRVDCDNRYVENIQLPGKKKDSAKDRPKQADESVKMSYGYQRIFGNQ